MAKSDEKKVTISMVENETEIDCVGKKLTVLVRKEQQ